MESSSRPAFAPKRQSSFSGDVAIIRPKTAQELTQSGRNWLGSLPACRSLAILPAESLACPQEKPLEVVFISEVASVLNRRMQVEKQH
jgi:hypothetical protein